VPPDSVDWSTAQSDSFPYIVREDAGPENPLGRIKFMCPNEYDVYLHDTPGRSHFRSAVRDLSHGCVRVEDPMALAEYLLRGTPLASADSVSALIEEGAWRQVGLKRPVPVHIVYWTAWADSAGVPQFRDDLYGIDCRMDEALRSGDVGNFVLNPKVEWRDSTATAPTAMVPAGAASARAAVAAGPAPPSRPAIFGRR
jgi:murein L,D-transpeptidase YcbB/YkuD